MSLIDQALAAGAAKSEPVQARTAFVIGNVGKLGEELLNVLLENPAYERVAVGVRRAMRTVLPRLDPVIVPADRRDWNPAATLGRAPDDLYLCLEPARASFWKLARPYVEISSGEAVAMARRLRAAGSRRLAVLTPLEALAQLGAGAAIRDADEMALVEAGFERLVILRPSAEEQAATGGESIPASVGRLVIRTLASIMTPKQLQPIRARKAAQAVASSLGTLPDGVHVIGAARLREIAGEAVTA